MAVLCVLLALFCIVLPGSAVNEYYVRPTDNCPADSCLTLNDYMSDATKYFTSDTSFIFMEGVHYLNASLVLINITNMTFSGANTGVRIIVSAESGIVFDNSLSVTLSLLEIEHYGRAEPIIDNPSSSVLYFTNSHSAQISHTQFIGSNAEYHYKRALFYTQSTGMHVSNCSFSNGRGSNGGAIYMKYSSATFSAVRFISNEAILGGGGIDAFDSILNFEGYVLFVNNTAEYGGGLSTEQSEVTFYGNITFSQNVATFAGGGFYAITTMVNLFKNVNFIENRVMIEGGGGMKIEDTQLVLQSPVSVVFRKNKAPSFFGGAIYIEDSFSIYTALCANTALDKNCSIAVKSPNSSNMDIHLNFSHNTARAGSALFGGALERCRFLVNGISNGLNAFQFLQNVSTFTPGIDQTTSVISSAATRVCYCYDGLADCHPGIPRSLNTVRGKLFTVSLSVVGQLDMPVPATTLATIRGDDGSAEILPQSYISNGTCANFEYRLFTKYEIEAVYIFVEGCNPMGKRVVINLDPCPNGFNLTVDRCECDSALTELVFGDDITCDVDTESIRHPGSYWIRPVFDENQTYAGFIWRHSCPSGYCRQRNKSDPIFLNFSTTDSDSQCTENRTGILCGACKAGYSFTLNDFHCKICENKSISLIVAFGVAGIALIAVLLVLHMTVAAGTINGLILYANIVNVYRDIFFPPGDTHFNVNPLSIFIAWVNLDLGIPTCFSDGLDSYSYAWLEYVFPLYLWFLIGAIIISSKLSVKFGRLFGSNPVAVLATVILMSFTKLLQASVGALTFIYLEHSNGIREKVWIFDPNISYFEGEHIALATIALCVITFLLFPYIFLLTFGYRLQAYSGKKGFLWFNKLKPLLDAYYASYDNKTRFWTGFMLLVRVGLYLCFILSSINTSLIVVISIFMGVAFIPWLRFHIYEKLYLDIIEASFILNLCLLTGITYHIRTLPDDGNQAVVTYFSVGIAFMEFIGIFVFHVYLRLKDIKFLQNYFRSAKGASIKLTTSTAENPKAEHINTTFIDIREPLLEDN